MVAVSNDSRMTTGASPGHVERSQINRETPL